MENKKTGKVLHRIRREMMISKDLFRKCFLAILVAAMTMGATMSVWAGEWRQDGTGWWWQEDNGGYPVNTWQWIDGNRDGVAECYYFMPDGYLLVNGVTPDGYTINGDGAWTVDGIVQQKQVGTEQGTPEISQRQKEVMELVVGVSVPLERDVFRTSTMRGDDFAVCFNGMFLGGAGNTEKLFPSYLGREYIKDAWGYDASYEVFDIERNLKCLVDIYGSGVDKEKTRKNWQEGNQVNSQDKLYCCYADGDPVTEAKLTDFAMENGKLVAKGTFDGSSNGGDYWNGTMTAIFRPNADSFFGYTLESIETTSVNIGSEW